MEEPEINEICYQRFEEIDDASISIARLTNDFGTVLRYSVSIGKGSNHIQFNASESEFIELTSQINEK